MHSSLSLLKVPHHSTLIIHEKRYTLNVMDLLRILIMKKHMQRKCFMCKFLSYYIEPWSIIVSATLVKPAILAPMTRFTGLPYLFAALEQFRYIVFITLLMTASTWSNVQLNRTLFCAISSEEHATPPA